MAKKLSVWRGGWRIASSSNMAGTSPNCATVLCWENHRSLWIFWSLRHGWHRFGGIFMEAMARLVWWYTSKNWLVVWNMAFICSFSWECHHPNWRSHIFQRARKWIQRLILQANCDFFYQGSWGFQVWNPQRWPSSRGHVWVYQGMWQTTNHLNEPQEASTPNDVVCY